MKTTYSMDDMMEMSAGQAKKKKMSPEEFMMAVKGLIAQMENSNEYPNMESDVDSANEDDAEEENMTAGFVGEKVAVKATSKNAETEDESESDDDQEKAGNAAIESEADVMDKKVRLAAAKLQLKKMLGKK